MNQEHFRREAKESPGFSRGEDVNTHVRGAIRGEELMEVRRKRDGSNRWCFRCRARRRFNAVVHAPVDPMSWYGPTPSIRCATCDLVDGDLWPGRGREWEE